MRQLLTGAQLYDCIREKSRFAQLWCDPNCTVAFDYCRHARGMYIQTYMDIKSLSVLPDGKELEFYKNLSQWSMKLRSG